MMLNIFVPKANYTFDVAVEDLPPDSIAYILNYGARQAVVDMTAGVKRADFTTEEEFNATAFAKADKRWQQLLSGAVPGSRTPRSETTAKARKIAAELSDSEMDAALAFIMAEREKAQAA